ncbi:SNF1-related protein kinase regulatory subunit gamma-like PV42a [Magnolia sinica]|uniref:SNF1-related protein kinase regulatory subunit gamma-like PV42a n=1 Tax=Magnolia sinica TaxID=86752 RepID=UPI002658CFB4|nr:SNF1-related protein kinase regulatory subunit gamma-like PV42a [Magnolia sinica]
MESISPKVHHHHHHRWLMEKTVSDLIMDGNRRRLVEVPYTASLTDTMNALVANDVVTVPVAAPPGHWIGAGGSMILESDKITGVVRKHYIGIVTMLDILHHIAQADDDGRVLDLDDIMSAPVSSIIGYCLEGLSLWTLYPNTSILDCMEVFSKCIHRALVPLDSHMEHVVGVELAESSPGYRMRTQMDVLRFLKENHMELKEILSQSVGQLGAVNENVFSATQHTKVIEAIKFMRNASVGALPIVDASEALGEEDHEVTNVKGRKLIGTFSATDLRGCSIALLQSSLPLSVVEFTERVSVVLGVGCRNADVGHSSSRMLITCYPETSLTEVINKAVDGHVHRVWVVDQRGLLLGLISLTDVSQVIRASVSGMES